MLHKPKDPIQMNQQRENNQKKEKPKQIPQPQRNPLQDLYPQSYLQYSSHSNHSSSSSSSHSSHSSKHLFSTKPKSLLKTNRNTTSVKPRMGLPNNGSRKTPSIQKNAAFPKPKSKIGQRSNFSSEFASGCEKSEHWEKPKSKNAQRSNFSSDLASGCEKSEVSGESINVRKIGNGLNVEAESVTPVNKSFCGSSLDSVVFEDSYVSSKSNSEVKTPPLEASVSPEIQFGADLLSSAATPSVCYGTGHFLSGVTDRRKCRSRGILTVGDALDYMLGSGKDGNEIDCGYGYGGKVNEKVRESGSLIPLPVEASVKWLLSPCDENCASPKGDSSSKLVDLGDVEGSCPSVCIGSDPDLVRDSSEHVLGILDTPTDSGKTCMVSPRRFSDFEGDFLSNGLVRQDKNGFCRSNIEGKSPLSIGSLSSGNVIQTPNSDYTSGENRGECWLNMSEHGTCTLKPELDNHVSSVSVSSVDNMSQSHMRISWRDLLASRSSDMDELDCCRCLSDEDIGVDDFRKLSDDCSSRRENGKSTGSACKSPECVHDIDFPLQKKEKSSLYKLKSCAESISTDGGGLATSEDFD